MRNKAYQDLEKFVYGVYCGALGGKWSDDDFATAEQLGNIVPALQKMYDPGEKQPFLWTGYALRHYDNPKSATEFIYTQIMKG